MADKEDALYISHILEAIGKIGAYTNGVSWDEFSQNSMMQDGVMRQIEVIGEASRHLSDQFKKKSKSVPWNEIIGMRNKLIHGYMGVDIAAVWKTAQEDIPKLKEDIKKAGE